MAKKKSAPWYKKHWDKIVFLFLLTLFVLGIPGQNTYTTANFFGKGSTKALPPIPTPAPYPTNVTGTYPALEVSAQGVVVLDIDSGVFLYKRNEEELLSPASTTKILTALVALESFDL